MNTGYFKSPYDQRDYTFSNFIKPRELPPAAEIEPARFFNQGNRGTCVGAAFTLAKEIIELEDVGSVKLSVEMLYQQCKRLDDIDGEGTHPRIACKVLVDNGTCEERLLEYGDDRVFTGEMVKNAERYKIKSYLKINTLDEYKQAIAFEKTPVLLGAIINKKFRFDISYDDKTDRYVAWHPYEPIVGGHEFIGLGYDDNMEFTYSDGVYRKGFLKCQTTWMIGNKVFGDENGVFWIPYDYITHEVRFIDEMHILTDIKTGGVKMFKDVEVERWSKKAIDYVSMNDLMAGFPDGSFKPSEPLTREQMAQVLYNLSKVK